MSEKAKDRKLEFVEGSSSDFAKQKLQSSVGFNIEGPGLGEVNRATLRRDPKHLVFTLSRYKFIAKMLTGKGYVCEIGCHEGTGSLIVADAVKHLTATDFQPPVIEFCKQEYDKFDLNLTFKSCDALDGIPDSPEEGTKLYDAIYFLDVLEHIDPKQEHMIMNTVMFSLKKEGTLIVGIPSLESQQYASPTSKIQHINCKTKSGLKDFLLGYFENVFMFGMNDEVLHTGFDPMCQYIFGLCTGPK